MSEYMLDDYNQINDINPFVMKDFSLPGTWSDPNYSSNDTDKEPLEEKAQWDTPYVSPNCSMVALGDKTVSFCNPGEPNCPMSRPLVPEQLFEPGMWSYYPKKKSVKKGGIDWLMVALIVLILVTLVLFARR
tara:strand:- start:2049 stop:2444 length:396 start_codon:yes stop_codon:yes gene_type:complete